MNLHLFRAAPRRAHHPHPRLRARSWPPAAAARTRASRLTAAPAATATVVDGEVAITADDLVFDAEHHRGAGRRGVHDHLHEQRVACRTTSAIYTEEGGDEIVVGEVSPDRTRPIQIEVPALEAGTYYFRATSTPT